MAPLLSVDELFLSFGRGDAELQILRKVDLQMDRGEFVAVMGQSGSGKSSLLHVIAGLQAPTAGRIRFEDEDLQGRDENALAQLRRARIGIVFQNFHLMPWLTARQNVELPLRVNGQSPRAADERIRELMERMDVWKRKDHFPHQLSGGELQRVSVARALICDPPLLLADEPTGNLATQAGEEVLRLLRAATDEGGRSVLMVTHNPYDAARADRVLFLKDGVLDAEHALTRGSVDAPAVLDRLKELGI